MKLLLVGCGAMGSALLRSWVTHKIADEIIVIQPSLSKKEEFIKNKAVAFYTDIKHINGNFKPDVIVLAIKPQQLRKVIPSYAQIAQQAIIISFLAGITIENLYAYFSSNQLIVRIMPNVAMQVSGSVNLTYTDSNLTKNDHDLLNQLFKLTGKMIWLKSEQLIDILTPISGSGPAYFFLIAEILTHIAIHAGLTEIQARELVQQTFCGSAALASQCNNFAQLVNSVASKGGVTEAALQVLQADLPYIFTDAFDAALNRIKELNQ